MTRRLFASTLAGKALAAQVVLSGNATITGVAGIGINVSPVAPPAGLGFTPSFVATRNDNGVYAYTFNIQSVKPSFSTTIFVGPGGSNSSNGLTYGARVRSLKQAVTLANSAGGSVRIFADAAQYLNSSQDGSGIPDDFGGIVPSCPTLVMEVNTANGNGQAVSVHNQLMPAYAATSDANIYASTYTTQVPNRCCWDAAHLNLKGRPQSLRNVSGSLDGNTAAIISAINAMWSLYSTANQGQPMGASYLDVTNKIFYVRLSDNRAPDANLFTGRGVTGNANSDNLVFSPPFATNQIFWAQNFDWWGGGVLRSFVFAPDANPTLTTYLNNCGTLYSIIDGIHFDGAGSTYLVNHVTMDSYEDGFNWTASASGSARQFVYELSCYSGWSGNDDNLFDTSKNGTSAHLNTSIVRINGLYDRAQNRTAHDGQDCKSWNLGCSATNCRQTGVQSSAFTSGLAADSGDTCIVYLDGCVTTGNTYNLQAYSGGTLLTRNINTAGFNNLNSGGTIGTY